LAAGVLRVDGQVVSAYQHGSGDLFNIVARDSIAERKKRSVRFPALGSIQCNITKYHKLTVAIIMITDKYYLYAFSKSSKNSMAQIRKLRKLVRNVRAALR
jgi:hypothetical protein